MGDSFFVQAEIFRRPMARLLDEAEEHRKQEVLMATLPNGTYGVTVNNSDTTLNSTLSGVLVVSGPSSATYNGTDVSSSFNSTSGSIGWAWTPSGGQAAAFSNGTYNAGPPATLTGGSVSQTGTSGITWTVLSLPSGIYAVVVTGANGVSGALNVSGSVGTQTATYKGQAVNNLSLTSGQVGWVVVIPPSGPQSTTYTFSDGVYIPGERPHELSSGLLAFPSEIATEDTWTADAGPGPDETPKYADA